MWINLFTLGLAAATLAMAMGTLMFDSSNSFSVVHQTWDPMQLITVF
jgi:hypothetical protein